MCGIVGVRNLDGEPVDPARLEAAARSLRHRGPDDEGYFYGDGLALASRRLAILDLSSAGHQPMSNEDGTVWITYNGEIYNHRSLRDELERGGHVFRSRTDTEVVIHAYEEWGDACLHRFNGMWAFAIWDSSRRRLFCARDRYGVKPFYYAFDGKTFAFASEIKALLAAGVVRPAPNDEIVHDYLAFGMIDHTDETFFRGVRALPGGHCLDLRAGDRAPRIWTWYELPPDGPALSDEECSGRFYALFEDAVRLRLVADVPVGTCLSGGLDSSSIACLAGRLIAPPTPQRTFSARYKDPRHDEGRFIEEVARHIAIDPIYVFPTAEGLAHDLDDLIRHQDEPVGTTSAYAQWCVFRSAREAGVTVTLDGQGGDEVLGGYAHFFGPLFADLVRRGRLASLVREVRAHRARHGAGWAEIARSTGVALAPRAVKRELKDRFGRPAWLAVRNGRPPRLGPGAFDAMLRHELVTGLPKMLRFVDRSSMAHSIEARLPFLDYRLVELAAAARSEQKIRDGATKWILRKAMRSVLPEAVRLRQDKVGFSTPEDRWFREELRGLVAEVVGSTSFGDRGYFDVPAVQRALDDHLTGRQNISTEIWKWVNLELWLRRFVD